MGKKKEFIAINEELVVCFDEESNVCVFGKLIRVSESSISLKREINNDIIEIPINSYISPDSLRTLILFANSISAEEIDRSNFL